MDTSYLNRNGKYETHGDYSHFMALAACKRKAAHVTTDNYKVCMVHLVFAFAHYLKCILAEPSLQHSITKKIICVECARSYLIYTIFRLSHLNYCGNC